MGGLEAIFEPKSVVLIGSSGIREGVGAAYPVHFRSVIHNMSRFYKGKTYTVDLSGELSGVPKSIKQAPKKFDLAVLMLPPELTLKHLRKLLYKRMKVILVVAGGYAQEPLEQLVYSAKKKGVRILGPNTLMGVVNTANSLCATAGLDTMPKRGNLSILSKFGGLGAAMLDWVCSYNIGISKFASLGDEIDVCGADLIEYLAGDKDTKVICLYLEWVKKGRRLFDVLREAVKRKPVVVLKGGITQGEGRPALSQTASLAGWDEIFDTALEQAGAITVQNVRELFDAASVLTRQPLMRGDRVAILSNVADQASLAVNAIRRGGLELASFSDEAIKAIAGRYPDIAPDNPVDLSTNARAERYEFVLEKVLADPNVDGALVVSMFKSCSLQPEDVRVLTKVANKFKDKPIVNVTMGRGDYALIREVLKETDVPAYDLPERASWVLKALHLYWKIHERSKK